MLFTAFKKSCNRSVGSLFSSHVQKQQFLPPIIDTLVESPLLNPTLVQSRFAFPLRKCSELFTVAPEGCVKWPELAGTSTILKTLTSVLVWAWVMI